MEFLMSETKVYAILTAGYDRKERMEGRILGERTWTGSLLGAEKNPGRYVAHYHQRLCGIFLYNRKVRHLLREIPKHVEDKKTDFLTELLPWSKSLPEHIGKLRQQ